MARARLDAVLFERGLFTSRERSRAAVLAGEVRVDGVVVTKAGQGVDPDAVIEVAARQRYVSRGGEKLAGALAAFELDPAGLSAIDVGASTGGFTDCLLQAGAASVVALDVGYGQLAWSLRTDPRVTVYERLNVRQADPVALGAPFDLVVTDVSFISLATVLPSLVSLMHPAHGRLVALVKPQFEAGKDRVGKKGVVRDASVHADVLHSVVDEARSRGLSVYGLTFSPITGPEGNIEFWIHAGFGGVDVEPDVDSVVAEAHQRLGR